MTEYYLWLLQLMGAANPKSLKLIEHYGSVEAVFNAVSRDRDLRFLSKHERNILSSINIDNSRRIIEDCRKKGISIVTVDDGDYPFRLKNISNPPLLLFYKGNIKGLDDEICISGVGARSATEYTAKVTRRTCMDLAKIGVVLVSGMAVGVDHLVHQSALDVGGRTIGVLACGICEDYPKGSIPTRERIYELGGACISELLPGAKTSRMYFHARNRIISGLSVGTIVFQASMNSGSLITANHAVDQSRDLFCVPPHDIFSPEYAGVVSYLRDGAIPLFNYLDVVNFYFQDFENKLKQLDGKYTIDTKRAFAFIKINDTKSRKAPSRRTESNTTKTDFEEQVKTDTKRAGEIAAEKFNFEENEPEYKRIYDFLTENGKQNLESITSKCGISPDDVSLFLMEMEMEGIIEAMPGANFRIKE